MTKFSDLKLDPKVLKAIEEAGYATPTPIQAGAIPPALEGRDVLGIAQTGTGKTASFTLPMITLLGRGRARARMPRSLVLCPTRELAAQVAENFDTYAKHTRLTKALLIGGVSFGEQDKLIDRGVDVLIATPGRLLDHFERGKLLLTGVQIMVVDEADRMLDMGFIPDIERIFQLTPFTRQTLFFSATMAPEIERITNTFLHSPERIEVARQATASETITQRLVEITPTRRDQTAKQKRELLRALIDAEGPATETGGLKNAIIFCNRKTEVDIVAKSLKRHGYDAAPIHGDLDQSQRMRTLDGFRDGSLRFLIASDVAARGLDIPAVSHVFNFDLPSHAEDYVHRIGRTGRAGRQGTAISIGVPADEKYLAAIENLVKQTLPRGALPEGFALSDAAQQPPREDRGERRGKGGRDRDRDRGRRGDRERGERDRPARDERPATAPSAPEPASARSDERSERRSERGSDRGSDRGHDRGSEARDTGGRDRREDRRDDRREDRREDRRGHRDRDGRRDSGVVGMGDHVPEFLTQVFTPGYTETPEMAEPTPDRPAATPADESKGRSRRRGRGRDGDGRDGDGRDGEGREGETAGLAAVADAPAEAVPAPDAGPDTADHGAPAADVADTPATPETAEAPKRTRRRKAAATEAPAEAEAEPETAAQPKPRRRRKAEPAEAAADTPVAEPAAKPEPIKPEPVRRSRRKTADAEPAPADPAAPRTRRRRKAEPAPAGDAAAVPSPEPTPEAPPAAG